MKAKIIAMVLGLLSTIFTTAQIATNFRTLQNLRLVVIGDSHTVDTPPSGGDSIWVNRLAVYLRQFFPTVTVTNLGKGGLSTVHMMPNWYGGTSLNDNIDTALTYHPDLLIISSSGNSTVVRQEPADTSIKQFKYLVDTLRGLNRVFILTGQDARQKTFVAPITAQTYHDTSTRINNWMLSYCPRNYANTYKRDYDNVVGLRPWPYVLRNDSLHKSDIGHKLYYEAHKETPVIDSILTYFKASARNIRAIWNGFNITVSGTFRYKYVKIYGSNNYSTFALLHTFETDPAYEREEQQFSQTFANGYTYYKIEIIGRRSTKTITVHL